MAQSTDAILAYGFDLGSEEDLPIELLVAAQVPEDPEYREWIYAEEGFPGIEIIRHCSESHVMIFLSLKGTQMRAKRGYPQNVGVPSIPGDSLAQLDQLDTFCKKFGIDSKAKAHGWHIMSMWS